MYQAGFIQFSNFLMLSFFSVLGHIAACCAPVQKWLSICALDSLEMTIESYGAIAFLRFKVGLVQVGGVVSFNCQLDTTYNHLGRGSQ